MGAQRPHAITANDQFLGLILDELEAHGEVLRGILGRLLDRTVVGQSASGAEPTAVSEPASERQPNGGKGELVQVTEPAPPSTGDEELRPVSEPAPQRKPRPSGVDDDTSVPPPPPRAGRGSGLEAWRSFASLAGVQVSADAGRDDIIAACEKANVIAE